MQLVIIWYILSIVIQNNHELIVWI